VILKTIIDDPLPLHLLPYTKTTTTQKNQTKTRKTIAK
jgi:hypothetical protein